MEVVDLTKGNGNIDVVDVSMLEKYCNQFGFVLDRNEGGEMELSKTFQRERFSMPVKSIGRSIAFTGFCDGYKRSESKTLDQGRAIINGDLDHELKSSYTIAYLAGFNSRLSEEM